MMTLIIVTIFTYIVIIFYSAFMTAKKMMNKKQKVKKADERRLKYIKSIEDGLANFDKEIKLL